MWIIPEKPRYFGEVPYSREGGNQTQPFDLLILLVPPEW
jgi:hypothetical protein